MIQNNCSNKYQIKFKKKHFEKNPMKFHRWLQITPVQGEILVKAVTKKISAKKICTITSSVKQTLQFPCYHLKNGNQSNEGEISKNGI
mmetsp:Transcript_71/g.94  ORF Transcript_71/g.94 Transcript_71/m.94 type:complete len:88 (-) Transcript_71:195-458(-)